METDKNLAGLQNEVLRKIGRNLFIQQKTEWMLKQLIANGKIAGCRSRPDQDPEKQAWAVTRRMMAQFASRFADAALQPVDAHQTAEEAGDCDEPFVAFTFAVSANAGFYESKERSLKDLVNERNHFINHRLPHFDLHTAAACLEAERDLDRQLERLVREFRYLKSLMESFKAARKIYLEEFDTQSGKIRLDLTRLRQSPIVKLLLTVAAHPSRPDGWTLLNYAGQQVRQTLPGEMEQLKSAWGYKTLKELMFATELFDVVEEATDRGGIRLLYRIRSENG